PGQPGQRCRLLRGRTHGCPAGLVIQRFSRIHERLSRHPQRDTDTTRHRHPIPGIQRLGPPALTRNEGVALWYERVIDHVVVTSVASQLDWIPGIQHLPALRRQHRHPEFGPPRWRHPGLPALQDSGTAHDDIGVIDTAAERPTTRKPVPAVADLERAYRPL